MVVIDGSLLQFWLEGCVTTKTAVAMRLWCYITRNETLIAKSTNRRHIWSGTFPASGPKSCLTNSALLWVRTRKISWVQSVAAPESFWTEALSHSRSWSAADARGLALATHENEAGRRTPRGSAWFRSLCPAVRRSTRHKLGHGSVILANCITIDKKKRD